MACFAFSGLQAFVPRPSAPIPSAHHQSLGTVLSPTPTSVPRCAIRAAATHDPEQLRREQLSLAKRETFERAQANAELLVRLAETQAALDAATAQMQRSTDDVAVAVG